MSFPVGLLAGQLRYYVCASVTGCSKRLRRSEREFVGDHAHLHQEETWYRDLTPAQTAALVNVSMGDEKAHEKIIEELAQGSRPRAFTLAAVSQQTRTLAGHVYASFDDETLKISQLKVERSHQGKGLGGLLLKAAEKKACQLGASIATVKLSVLESNEGAQRCYAKSGFKMSSAYSSSFPPCACKAGGILCHHEKIRWLRMEKALLDNTN